MKLGDESQRGFNGSQSVYNIFSASERERERQRERIREGGERERERCTKRTQAELQRLSIVFCNHPPLTQLIIPFTGFNIKKGKVQESGIKEGALCGCRCRAMAEVFKVCRWIF